MAQHRPLLHPHFVSFFLISPLSILLLPAEILMRRNLTLSHCLESSCKHSASRCLHKYSLLQQSACLGWPANIYSLFRCIWKDASNTWQAFLDVCPHRLIPLSEGRITDAKELQCAYHGWCFEASGKCTAIPQGGNANNPRTSATVYPCTVKQGELT